MTDQPNKPSREALGIARPQDGMNPDEPVPYALTEQATGPHAVPHLTLSPDGLFTQNVAMTDGVSIGAKRPTHVTRLTAAVDDRSTVCVRTDDLAQVLEDLAFAQADAQRWSHAVGEAMARNTADREAHAREVRGFQRLVAGQERALEVAEAEVMEARGIARQVREDTEDAMRRAQAIIRGHESGEAARKREEARKPWGHLFR